MATYLTSSRPLPPAAPPAPAAAPPSPGGRQIYVQLCSACHGVEGEGIPHVAPPMRTNASLRFNSPLNLLVAVTGGLPDRALPGGERYQAMPAFGHLLDDRQLADLANWLRVTWGAAPATVTPDEARAARPTPR
jgi:mono/diheme cytochrome c family protein